MPRVAILAATGKLGERLNCCSGGRLGLCTMKTFAASRPCIDGRFYLGKTARGDDEQDQRGSIHGASWRFQRAGERLVLKGAGLAGGAGPNAV